LNHWQDELLRQAAAQASTETAAVTAKGWPVNSKPVAATVLPPSGDFITSQLSRVGAAGESCEQVAEVSNSSAMAKRKECLFIVP
jgi:hypothetical protein